MKKIKNIGVLIFLIGAFGGGLGYILFRSMSFEKIPTNPFYMEPFMTVTKKLESSTAIIEVLNKMDESSICGLKYNVRVSQTSGDAKLVLDCGSQRWIDLRNYLGGSSQYPFEPYGIKKFALIKVQNSWSIYTEEKNGENKFEELVEGIPKIALEVIRIFPGLKKSEEERRQKMDAEQKTREIRQEEVKSSF